MYDNWFYNLATDVDSLVDKVNEDLGQDIYYTVWNTKDCVVEITDSRDDQVSYLWSLEYWRNYTKDKFCEKFDSIINNLKSWYTIRENLRKAKEEKMTDKMTMPMYDSISGSIYIAPKLDYSKIATTDCSSLNWSKLEELSYIRIAPEWKKWKNKIERVIFNDPATIILWKSGERTVVKCGPNEQFDKEKGLAMALCKYILGNKGNFNEFFKSFMEEENDH